MSIFKWGEVSSEELAMSTELNSLAAGARNISGTLSNDQALELDVLSTWMLEATFAVAPVAGELVNMYLLPTVDGTNFEDGSASVVPPAASWVGAFPVRAVTTLQRVAARGPQPKWGIVLPPVDFRVILQNDTGQALTASGHQLNFRRHNFEIA